MGTVTAPDCSEWRGLLAMDAIGRASYEESQALAEHVAGCAGCRADADQVRVAAEALALVDVVPGEPAGGGSPVEQLGAVEGRPAGVVPLSLSGPPPSTQGSVPGAARRPNRPGWRRRWVFVGAAAAAAAVVAAFLLSGAPAPPARTVALSGQPGVQASISLTSQKWGTRATLRESGQASGQVLTVSMESTSGRWWVAGSYRTTGGHRSLTVQLSCAVPADQVTVVWVSDQKGRTVLDGSL